MEHQAGTWNMAHREKEKKNGLFQCDRVIRDTQYEDVRFLL